ncbi:MAG: hypothetical protein ACOZE5_08920 [Verrucomicrobiota bacterium]
MLVSHSAQRRITPLLKLSPGHGDFALSRDGVPIFAANNPDEAAVARFFADAHALLGLPLPGNPLGWPDRVHHASTLHAARHQNHTAGPVLVGDPLVPQGLRERGIFRIAARIEVGSDGKATTVTLQDEEAIPEAMRKALAGALQKAVFAPAMDHGQPVAGTYDYLIEVPR